MTEPSAAKFDNVENIVAGLGDQGYIASRQIATAIFVAENLTKPILVEGSAGVGKTELALASAAWLGLPLIRMQCYEGLDESKALYEWKYGKQLLYTQILKDKMGDVLGDAPGLDAAMQKLHGFGDMFFSEQFLEPRPLLKALRQEHGAVLLIDEIDKSDEEFEAFLLEILSAYQVTIPEIGTLRAERPPIVIITSNRTREIHDALKRRCFYYWVDYPDAERELEILSVRAPGTPERLSRQIVGFVQSLRTMDLFKSPGVAETIDWADSLNQLNRLELDPDGVNDTLGALLKYQDDIVKIQGSEASRILDEVNTALKTAAPAQ